MKFMFNLLPKMMVKEVLFVQQEKVFYVKIA